MTEFRFPTFLATAALARPATRGAALAWFGRPFPQGGARRRLVIYGDVNRITFAQIHPFLHLAPELAAAHGVAVRLHPFERLADPAPLPEADIVVLAPWFTVPPETLSRALDRLAAWRPEVPLAFLDSFAHNDLRLAPILADRVALYVKKSLFRDRSLYRRSFQGTQLQDFYGRLYGIDEPATRPEVPDSLLRALRLGPGFLLAPDLRPRLRAAAPPPFAGRSFDLHIRIETRGRPWYQAMRQDVLTRALALSDLRLTPPERVSKRLYDGELRQSRLCLSPFGYGELCWRDVEAVAAGAVLIKPDMGHLESLPEMFEPGVTYLPIRWDFTDLEAVVRAALADPDRLARIARAAWHRLSDYIAADRFVPDMADLFRLTCTRSTPPAAR